MTTLGTQENTKIDFRKVKILKKLLTGKKTEVDWKKIRISDKKKLMNKKNSLN